MMNSSLVVEFIAPESIADVMMLAQYANKCDVAHCDCSSALAYKRDGFNKVQTKKSDCNIKEICIGD
jgi:hypothetical protein